MNSQSISVIIPLFSQEIYARRAITGVVEQTLKPKELILVDDSLTPWIHEKYLTSISHYGFKVRYLRNETNLGSAASLNLGMSLSTSEILCMLNDDDFFAPNRLSEISRISLSSDLGKFWGFSNVNLIDAYGAELSTSGIRSVDKAIAESRSRQLKFETLESSNFAVSSGNLFLSKKLFELGYGFDESLKHVQDWYLTQRLFLNSDPKILHDSTYYYRMHESNTFRVINPKDTFLECEAIRKAIRAELWKTVDRERIFELLSYKVLDLSRESSSVPNHVGVINGRAYTLVDFIISKLHKKKILFSLITFVGRKFARFARF